MQRDVEFTIHFRSSGASSATLVFKLTDVERQLYKKHRAALFECFPISAKAKLSSKIGYVEVTFSSITDMHRLYGSNPETVALMVLASFNTHVYELQS